MKTLKRAKALKRAKTHGKKDVSMNGKMNGGVSGFDTNMNRYWSDIIYINNFKDNLSNNLDETIRYFVLCTDMMSKFYDYCKQYASFDLRYTFDIEDNDFTKGFDTFLEDQMQKRTGNASNITSSDLLFFPFTIVKDDVMAKILENEENCILLSKYIRHMKKIIMGYKPHKTAHPTANKSFAKIYNPEYYPEWKELTWPKSEFGLNKLLDQRFCQDIRSKKFTLAENIPKNAIIYPGFLELINHNDPIYTSFTIAGIEPTSTLHKYHNDLLQYLQQIYKGQRQTGGFTRKSSFPISRKTRRRKQTSQ